MVSSGGPVGTEGDVQPGEGSNWMMGVKRKEKETQSIDFHCVSLEA